MACRLKTVGLRKSTDFFHCGMSGMEFVAEPKIFIFCERNQRCSEIIGHEKIIGQLFQMMKVMR